MKDQQKPEVNEQQYDINGEQSEIQKPSENSVAEDAQEPPQEVSQPHYAEEPQQGDAYTSANHNLTHKMEVPNNKVSWLYPYYVVLLTVKHFRRLHPAYEYWHPLHSCLIVRHVLYSLIIMG